ncbi:serine--tRNA ligase [Candidatus Woesearchaeota archaeon]|nr:serine--tRNA ligase [Candidatus Woesearchaeota archaeon]
MLDMKFIRENPHVIKKDLEKRGNIEKQAWVDEIISKDEKYRKLLQKAQKLRAQRNAVSRDINRAKKEGKDIKKILAEARAIPDRIKRTEQKGEKLKKDILEKRMRLPNILHESVPKGKDESGNVVLREEGKKRKADFEMMPHGEWLEKKKQGDFKRAAKTSGAGFYFLKDKAALLDFALQKFAIDKLAGKGYTLVEPPFMIRREPYEGVTDLADFENVMYKIDNDDLYLIATSEHAIGAMHMNETFEEDMLPVKYAGISACFRREIGSHGIDTRGLFRVHQFNKIEQFVFCRPEDSWKFHEELLANAEELFKELELPYRVVNICTGDIGMLAAKKYDIEVWMPREGKYREAVSCSNDTSYQAVRLNIKYKTADGKDYVHTLNSTAIATSRALRAIIENNVQKDGTVLVPKVLLPYMNGVRKI